MNTMNTLRRIATSTVIGAALVACSPAHASLERCDRLGEGFRDIYIGHINGATSHQQAERVFRHCLGDEMMCDYMVTFAQALYGSPVPYDPTGDMPDQIYIHAVENCLAGMRGIR